MAINLGAFLGAAAKSGLDTYERLGEEEFRAMQREKMRREIEQEKKLEEAFAKTQGRVGQRDDYGVAIQQASGNQGLDMGQAKALSAQGALPGQTQEDIDFERASAQAAAGAMRENAVRQGRVADAALPTMEAQEYTQRQANRDFAQAAAGISRKGYLEALALKKETRQSELDDKFDLERETLNTNLSLINGTAESKGMKGLAELASKNGLKVQFVESKSGVGKINVLGPKGDVLQTITSIGEATQALEKAALQKFQTQAASLLGGPAQLLTYLNQREELGLKREQVGIEREYKGKGGVIDTAYNQRNAPKDTFGSEGVKAYFDELKNLDPKAKTYQADKRRLDEKYAPILKGRTDGAAGNLADQVGQVLLNNQKGGQKPSSALPAREPRKFEGQKFGKLTPMSVIEEAAEAGNKDAIKYLESIRARDALAQEQRTRDDILAGQLGYGGAIIP